MSPNVILNLSVLVALVCWGAWGIFDKFALRAAPERVVLACLYLYSLPAIVLSVVLLNVYEPGWMLNWNVMLWTFFGSAAYCIGMLAYLKAMNMTEASYVLGATSSYPIILQFVSSLFLAEPLVPTRIIGSILVALGVVAVSFSHSQTKDAKVPKNTPLLVLLMIFCTLLWGVWGIFDKKAIIIGGSALQAYLGKCVWDLVLGFPFIIYVIWEHRFLWSGSAKSSTPNEDGENSSSGAAENGSSSDSSSSKEASSSDPQKLSSIAELRSPKLWTPVTLSAICLNAGSLAYLIALSLATASYVIVITGCYPLVMYLLAVVLLKERFNRLRLAGIVLVTIGGIVTQTTQGL